MHLLRLLLLVVFPVALAAAPYRPGDSLETFTTKDQHERTYTWDGKARLVLIAFEMGTGKATNAFLEKQPAGYLDDHTALFIANIYGMPGIGRAFALPKMRKYPHRILLADAEGFLDRYPHVEDRLTVLTLDAAGKVTAIRFVNPKQGLAGVFAAKP